MEAFERHCNRNFKSRVKNVMGINTSKNFREPTLKVNRDEFVSLGEKIYGYSFGCPICLEIVSLSGFTFSFRKKFFWKRIFVESV